MAEKWIVAEQPYEREIVRSVEYGVFAKEGEELVANVTSREDARLIAASPLMLEALVAAEDHLKYNGYIGDGVVLGQIKAAIAAALEAAKEE